MSRRRHTADSITDDDLDALYRNANTGWRRGDRWKRKACAAQSARDELLRIAATWYVAVNNGLGYDAGDLIGAIERAGYQLPEETSTP
jgi:hypothetical protein